MMDMVRVCSRCKGLKAGRVGWGEGLGQKTRRRSERETESETKCSRVSFLPPLSRTQTHTRTHTRTHTHAHTHTRTRGRGHSNNINRLIFFGPPNVLPFEPKHKHDYSYFDEKGVYHVSSAKTRHKTKAEKDEDVRNKEMKR